jgi:hypothetical protein
VSPFGADRRWLFGRGTDVAVFGGSAAVSLALLALGVALGIADEDAPGWVFLSCVVAVDVAHVWSTAFRVYLDGAEVRRRPLLYVGLPLACWLAGVAAYAISAAVFWRLLAYVAVLHFVRQQAGWMTLYRRRAPDGSRLDAVIDGAAIYAATLGPLVWWHAHLPRRFAWFVPGDFVAGIPAWAGDAALAIAGGALAAFALRQMAIALRRGAGAVHAGKVLLVATTAAAWGLGIVAFDGDYAFTVTNVLVHGIPYFALTYRWGRMRAADGAPVLRRVLAGGLGAFLALLVSLAVVEEGLWDALVWHEHGVLGGGFDLAPLTLVFVVPLLALPQSAHYALDGFVWRTRDGNPALAAALRA